MNYVFQNLIPQYSSPQHPPPQRPLQQTTREPRQDKPKQTVRVDPYKLFQLDPQSTFSRSDIRQKMRELVLITHPDRPGGTEEKFQIVMKCYKHLIGVVADKARLTAEVTTETVREHEQNRTEQEKAYEIPDTNAKQFYSSKKFNREAFNNFFEENRLDDSLQRGHGDWLKDNNDTYKQKHTHKLGKGQFQESFEEERRKLLAKKQIVKHTGVVPMSLGKSRLAAADVDEIGMMSSQNAGTVRCSNGIMGVDIREALEIGVLGTADAPDTDGGPVTMEEARRQRENARMTLTPQEQREYEEYQQNQIIREMERKQRIQNRDEQIYKHFQQVNRMITNH